MSDFDYKMPVSRFNHTRPSVMVDKIEKLEKENQRLREENEDLRGVIEHTTETLEDIVCNDGENRQNI